MITGQMLDKCRIHNVKAEEIKRKNVVWLDFSEPSKNEIKQVSEITGMSEPEIVELLQPQTRPLLTNIDKYSVIILQSPLHDGDDVTKPVLVFISKKSNDLITMHMHEMGSIKRMLAWEERRKVRIFEKGTTYILYSLIDEIAASYSSIMNNIDDNIEKLEAGIYEPSNEEKHMMQHAFEVKKRLIYFYKALTANREVVSAIEKEYGMFLDKKDLSKFRLLHSDFTQLVELTVTYRDILTTTIEVYLSVVSNNLNITVKKLTAWGAIILIPTIVSGIYGMNFKHIPEVSWLYGYPFALSMMLASVIIAFIYFKRKEWL
ncbi:MAG: magnesium transporter CorA family protein [Candidatus Nanoarchaeia archaeon]|jgi:magnesium transporter